MKRIFLAGLAGLCFSLTSCFSREEKAPTDTDSKPVAVTKAPEKKAVPQRDKSLDVLVRYLGEADSIHREAWWVLNNERPAVGKSPFGKVQRAFLASQNIKLANKSLFRCDRYIVQKLPSSAAVFPQNFEIYEKCSEKLAGKKIAEVKLYSEKSVKLIFLSENLEEILGLGATVLSLHIECELQGDEQGHLLKLHCKDWAQDRSKEQMIRLSVYDYTKSGNSLIKLRGKVFENLTDIRKIEADVPLEGKIFVTETELYPPEPTPTPTPSPAPNPSPTTKPKVAATPPTIGPVPGHEADAPGVLEGWPEGEEPPAITPLHLPPPRSAPAQPDELMQQNNNDPNNPQAPVQEVPLQEPAVGGVRGR